MSLVETLKLIQEWQAAQSPPDRLRYATALLTIDIGALTLQAAQHAQLLRDLANGPLDTVRYEAAMLAVADWLAPEVR